MSSASWASQASVLRPRVGGCTWGRSTVAAPAPAVDDGEMHLTRRMVATFVAVLLLGPAACGDDGATAPTAGTSSSVTTSTTVAAARGVALYLVRDGLLAAVARDVAVSGAIAATITALLQGPGVAETRAGFATAIPAGTRLNSVTVAGRVPTVDLSAQFASGGGSLSMMLRVAQVTYTVTQFAGVDMVRYRLDGQDLTVLGGEGLMLDHPQTRKDLEDVQPKILVELPAFGARVGHRFVALGTSNTFEATHQLQVRDRQGTVVFDAVVTATSGTGERGTWEKAVDLPAVVTGPATLRVFEVSAMDGSAQSIVDVLITVE